MQAWQTHSSGTGGYYSCNLYGSSKEKMAEVEKLRQDSKTQLDRYMFFFGRFMNHQKGSLLAEKELAGSHPAAVEKLHARYGFEYTDLEFLFEALSQVIECRFVLKYTYVYGFYLEDAGKVGSRELFEHLQKDLEEFTDRLHEFIEKDLDVFVKDEEEESEDTVVDVETLRVKFADFRSQVANQCLVTRRFFHTILNDLKLAE